MDLASKIAIGLLRARLNLTAAISPRRAAKFALQLFFTPFGRRNQRMPDVFKKAEHLKYKSGTGMVQLYRWNHPAPKRFLILHGFASCAFKFEAYVMPMVRKGFEVIAIDAPAHGRSEGRRVTLTEYIQAIGDAEKAFGKIDACLAHSFGGLAASLYFETSPRIDRPKITLIAPATETRRAIDTFFRFMQVPPSVQFEFEALIREKSGKEPDYFSVSRAIPNIPADILWVHDEQDDLTPLDDVRPVRQADHPHVRFHITKGLGHRRIYRDPEVRHIVTGFLSARPSHFSE